ncbi:MAG TPA: glycerate kinase [Caulobacteraceae bacterium]|jgi:hydroxypyruvate reductase|nr:glycerate kinase [Caulobacteraceae bacterium]
MSSQAPRDLLDSLFRAALAAADPLVRTPLFLPSPPRGRTVVAAFGKAAAMARAVEDHWHGPLSGLAVTRYGHGLACRRIEVIEASHPTPDAAAVTAAERMLVLAANLGEDDLLLALASGGGSALMTLPAPGLTLDDKRSVTQALLASGAPIAEINTVRRHLSAIKGGRLALAAAPAAVETLVISDVPGDNPAQVASGPTLPDRTTPQDALDVLARWKVAAPARVREHLQAAGPPLLPDDPAFMHVRPPRVIATAHDALRAAAAACPAGIVPVMLSAALEGAAAEVARSQAQMARTIAAAGLPARPPAVILSGGETTVAVRNPQGRGGRNTHYLLALAIALDGHPAIHAMACDTDGVDGTQDNAGAVVGPDTLARARALGLDPTAMLQANQAYDLFERLGDLVRTGPTRTNVNDFRAVLILPA